eukprot:CAMPEP_0113527224 /NCGR_PEP_ID=MMETSP0015_2-20120614/1176_1 /TAXON_ID=2838 /ORGANISM="Odontella" /LENGTH=311 /DNA_ID=CAMNT_0000425633 /DNA_START=61 /DNA_END=997 /DNA_ORIENTATION=- /assembly_acc=CAM_ASM_000160
MARNCDPPSCVKAWRATVFLTATVLCAMLFEQSEALAMNTGQSRRDVLATTAASIVGAVDTTSQRANAAVGGNLATKLSARDPAALKTLFSSQIHPTFMRGEWEVKSKFAGFLFPSKTIPKNKVTADVIVPGFQKVSIAALADVGTDCQYRMRIDERGLDDRSYTLAQQIDAHLGYKAVKEVTYDGVSNPNRLSLAFEPYKTRNAERIELFCNARESELVPNPTKEGLNIFVCSEYVRQVTFSFSQEFGVARQVVGNYAHFWTWREQESSNRLTGNVLTAAYLDPQDPLFFDEPSKPVVVYSHELEAQKVT